MVRMEVIPRAGCRRDPHQGHPLEAHLPCLERRQLEGLEAAGRSLGSSQTQMLAKMVVEVESSKTSSEASHLRPTVGGKPHTKSSLRGIKVALDVLAGDSSSL